MESSPDPQSTGINRAVGANRASGATLAMLIAVVAVAAALRLAGLGAASLWGDEVLTTYSAREPLSRVIDAVRAKENAPPVYFILVNVWVKAFGMSDVSLRLPSALIGIATVVLLWRVGTELFGDANGRRNEASAIGLTAAGLLAVSPIHIAYSQEARMYALLVLLLTLNLWAMVRIMRTRSTAAQVAYVATAALALLTHTFAVFALAAVNLFWLLRLVRGREAGVTWRRWLTLNAAVVVLFGPWVPATLEVAQMGLPWLIRPTPFHEAMIGYAGGKSAAIAMAGLSIVAAVRAWRRQDDRLILLFLLALVPVLGPIFYGPFTTRYGIAAMIALPMLVAYGAQGIGRWACVAVVALAALSWAMTSTPGHARYLNYTPKPDVRGAVELVRKRAQNGDAMVAGSREIWHVAEHYTRGGDMQIVDGVDAVERDGAERMWLIQPAGPDLPVTGYQERSRFVFDRIVVRELLRHVEPATTSGVPTTYPRN